MKLKTKLLVFFGLLFLFPTSIGGLLYVLIHNEIMELYQADLKTTIKIASHFIEDKKLQVETTALYLGKESRCAVALKNEMIDDIQTTINEKLAVTKNISITYIAIIDPSGKKVCQTGENGQQMNLPIDPDGLIETQNGNSKCYFTSIDKHLYLIGYAPLILNRKIIGTVMCASHIDKSFIHMIKDITDLTVSSYIDGEFSPKTKDTHLEKYPYMAERVIATGQVQAIRAYVDNLLHSLIFFPLLNDNDTPFAALCIQMPMKNMLYAERFFKYGMMSFFSFFLVLLIIFFVIADKYFLKPVAKLEQAALLVAQGDFGVELPEHHNDELGQLTESFNTMVQNLNQAQLELHDINRQLSDTNKQLEMYVLTVSHDLKSPILVIKNFLELFKQSLAANHLEEEQRMFLTRIGSNLDKMLVLIKDITEYFKLGKIGYDLHPVDFQDILDMAIQRLEDMIETKNAQIIVSEKLPKVKADKDRATTLMVNLLSNALRFVKEGTSPKIEISAEKLDGFYRFSVKDNGIGIAPQYHEHIFDIFYILGEVDAEHSSGVGLSMVKKIIEDHGGKIYVESEKGVGSNFIFTLPQV